VRPPRQSSVSAEQTFHTNHLHIVQAWSGYLADHVVAIHVVNGSACVWVRSISDYHANFLLTLESSVVCKIGSRWKAIRRIADTSFADETKPNCQRCEKAGFVCLGYERERLWRNSSTAPDPKPAPPPPESRNKVAVILRTSNEELTIQRPSPPPELSLVAFKDDFCFTVIFENHVWRSSAGPWLQPAINGQFGDLALIAIGALSKANFGKLFHAPGIEREGIALHGRCLKLLAGRLTTINRKSQELIVPILILLMHVVSSAVPDFFLF
jgi:hypothetical protein